MAAVAPCNMTAVVLHEGSGTDATERSRDSFGTCRTCDSAMAGRHGLRRQVRRGRTARADLWGNVPLAAHSFQDACRSRPSPCALPAFHGRRGDPHWHPTPTEHVHGATSGQTRREAATALLQTDDRSSAAVDGATTVLRRIVAADRPGVVPSPALTAIQDARRGRRTGSTAGEVHTTTLPQDEHGPRQPRGKGRPVWRAPRLSAAARSRRSRALDEPLAPLARAWRGGGRPDAASAWKAATPSRCSRRRRATIASSAAHDQPRSSSGRN